jgi:DNA-directed RNA polymerase specialized sigma24 family protein
MVTPLVADVMRQTIAEALARRDERAFVSVLETHHGRMLRFARVVEQDEGVARQVVKRAWLAALRDGAPPDAFPSLAAWLFSLVHEELRVPRLAPSPATGTDVDRASFEAESDRWAGHWRDDEVPRAWDDGIQARRHALEQGLRALPPLLAALLVLHDVERLDGLEITAVLGMTRDMQVALLHHARTMLRRALDERLASTVPSQ